MTAKAGPKEVTDQDSDIVREAKKQIARLVEKRAIAIKNLQDSITNMKALEQQSFMLRGKIVAHEEEIDDLRRRYGIEEEAS